MSTNVNEPGRRTEEDNNLGIPREIDTGISFLKIALGLAQHRRIVVGITGVFVALGLLNAFLSPSLYTATARMVREVASGNIPRGLSGRANLSGLGINLRDQPVGITPETYPDILRSREVLLAVAKSPFYIKELDTTMNLIEYYSLPPGSVEGLLQGLMKVTIGLPTTIVGLFKNNSPEKDVVSGSGERAYSAAEEEMIAHLLADQLSIYVDDISGVMSLSITTKDPQLSALVTSSFIDHLTKRVQDIYTDSSEDKMSYFRNRFDEAAAELEQAEKILARFIDRNWNPQTAQIQIELEGLRRQVTFKTELYSDLQTQLTRIDLELKRNQPVITILQAPFPPMRPSAPKRKRIVILSLLLGSLAGIVAVVIRIAFEKQMGNDESRAEWLEIKKIVSQGPPMRWMRRFRIIKSDAK